MGTKIAADKATSTKEKETVEIPYYKWCYGKFIKTGTLIEKK